MEQYCRLAAMRMGEIKGLNRLAALWEELDELPTLTLIDGRQLRPIGPDVFLARQQRHGTRAIHFSIVDLPSVALLYVREAANIPTPTRKEP